MDPIDRWIINEFMELIWTGVEVAVAVGRRDFWKMISCRWVIFGGYGRNYGHDVCDYMYAAVAANMYMDMAANMYADMAVNMYADVAANMYVVMTAHM